MSDAGKIAVGGFRWVPPLAQGLVRDRMADYARNEPAAA